MCENEKGGKQSAEDSIFLHTDTKLLPRRRLDVQPFPGEQASHTTRPGFLFFKKKKQQVMAAQSERGTGRVQTADNEKEQRSRGRGQEGGWKEEG